MLGSPDMRILGHIAFFLLLGSICCKNNRHAKFGGKFSRKSGGNQGADVSQPPPVHAAAGSTGRGSAGSPEAGRDGTAAARKAGQQTDDMRLHFLKNNQVTCNDGTAAGWGVPHLVSSLTGVDAAGFSLSLIYGSTGFTWRSQKEVADGWFFWKVRIFNFISWCGSERSTWLGVTDPLEFWWESWAVVFFNFILLLCVF